MSCKFVVKPHSQRKATGEAYKTKEHRHPVSQRGWRDAVRQAKSGSFRGEDSTIFLSCPRGSVRVATCHGSSTCTLDAELGGASTRVLAGARHKRRRR